MNPNSDHGTYRLSYTPPESKGNEYYPNITIDMSMDGEASVNHMLRFYEAFLAASGYVLKGELQIVEREEAFNKQYWQSKYLELMQVAGGEKVEEIVQDRDFWQEQTYKLLRPEE